MCIHYHNLSQKVYWTKTIGSLLMKWIVQSDYWTTSGPVCWSKVLYSHRDLRLLKTLVKAKSMLRFVKNFQLFFHFFACIWVVPIIVVWELGYCIKLIILSFMAMNYYYCDCCCMLSSFLIIHRFCTLDSIGWLLQICHHLPKCVWWIPWLIILTTTLLSP